VLRAITLDATASPEDLPALPKQSRLATPEQRRYAGEQGVACEVEVLQDQSCVLINEPTLLHIIVIATKQALFTAPGQ
jgi:hypothetical protein